MYYKSPFPDPPPVADINVHNAFFNRTDQAQWPDFTFHIDAETGKKRMYKEFVARVKTAITALGTPVPEGGLGIESGEMIGIMSENSMVFPFVLAK